MVDSNLASLPFYQTKPSVVADLANKALSSSVDLLHILSTAMAAKANRLSTILFLIVKVVYSLNDEP
jgi:hypothetical protein